MSDQAETLNAGKSVSDRDLKQIGPYRICTLTKQRSFGEGSEK